MGLREDVAAEIARQQAGARVADDGRREPAETLRRKFDDSQSTPEALEQRRRLTRDEGLYKQSEGGKSRLGSLPSSDALLEQYSWKPKGERPPEGSSRLFARNGEAFAQPNPSIGNG